MTPWLLLALTFALSSGQAMESPSWRAVLPELVPREDLAAAGRLERNAAAKRADATWIRIGIDERDLHAKVRSMKRGDVAAGAAPITARRVFIAGS
jgi:hypothetical protein